MIVDELLEGRVWTFSDVLTPTECATWVQWAEDQGFAEAPITTPFGFVRAPMVRNNTRVMVDHPEYADLLWQRLKPALPATWGPWEVVGLNERLRIYRYEPGQYFRRHSDGAFRRTSREQSLLTLMVYLNEDFEGGETSFRFTSVRPRTGHALAFEHRLSHAGEEVTRGRKYALRTDVMYRRA